MKIKTIRIQNFRSFEDETIHLNRYSCFVGPNGAGKSSVLAALNVFFHEQSGAATDVAKLTDEDYFGKKTANAVRITVTFDAINQTAQAELSAYGVAPVRLCDGFVGRRLGSATTKRSGDSNEIEPVILVGY